MIPIVSDVLGTIPKAERVENRTTNKDYLNYSVYQVSQNTEKSSEDLRRLSVTQTPEKDHKLIRV